MGKKGKDKGGKQKPEGWSDEKWALYNNLPNLKENLRGPCVFNTIHCTITRAEAAFYLWEWTLAKPSTIEELISLQCVQESVACVCFRDGRGGVAAHEKVLALGLMSSLSQHELGRDQLAKNFNNARVPPPHDTHGPVRLQKSLWSYLDGRSPSCEVSAAMTIDSIATHNETGRWVVMDEMFVPNTFGRLCRMLKRCSETKGRMHCAQILLSVLSNDPHDEEGRPLPKPKGSRTREEIAALSVKEGAVQALLGLLMTRCSECSSGVAQYAVNTIEKAVVCLQKLALNSPEARDLIPKLDGALQAIVHCLEEKEENTTMTRRAAAGIMYTIGCPKPMPAPRRRPPVLIAQPVRDLLGGYGGHGAVGASDRLAVAAAEKPGSADGGSRRRSTIGDEAAQKRGNMLPANVRTQLITQQALTAAGQSISWGLGTYGAPPGLRDGLEQERSEMLRRDLGNLGKEISVMSRWQTAPSGVVPTTLLETQRGRGRREERLLNVAMKSGVLDQFHADSWAGQRRPVLVDPEADNPIFDATPSSATAAAVGSASPTPGAAGGGTPGAAASPSPTPGEVPADGDRVSTSGIVARRLEGVGFGKSAAAYPTLIERRRMLRDSGAITKLIDVCKPPVAPAGAKPKKKKKDPPLPPGMLEAQADAATTLRYLSLDGEARREMLETGGVGAMTYMTNSKSKKGRRAARGALVNIGMESDSIKPMQGSGCPEYLQNLCTQKVSTSIWDEDEEEAGISYGLPVLKATMPIGTSIPHSTARAASREAHSTVSGSLRFVQPGSPMLAASAVRAGVQSTPGMTPVAARPSSRLAN